MIGRNQDRLNTKMIRKCKLRTKTELVVFKCVRLRPFSHVLSYPTARSIHRIYGNIKGMSCFKLFNINVVKCNPSHPLGHVGTGMCPKCELLAHILPASTKVRRDSNSF